MNSSNTSGVSAWIDDGEKYALVGLGLKIDEPVTSGPVGQNLWILANAGFGIPAQWNEWLGSIRTGQVEACNVFLLSKAPSSAPQALDAETQGLMQYVIDFYVGLMLASPFAPAHRPVMLTGSRHGGEIDVRQQQDLESPVPSIFRPYPPVLPKDFSLAAQLGGNLNAIPAAALPGGHWRIFQTLHIYVSARSTNDILERLHQYCRCIDGLILPEAGNTKRQFKSRTELFIGPRHHDLMGDIYDVRSAVEHLHDNRYLEAFDRATRLDLVEKEAIVEHIARTALARIIGDKALWTHFANTSALGLFWAMPAADRQRVWGLPIDVADALTDFDPAYINDGQLGAL